MPLARRAALAGAQEARRDRRPRPRASRSASSITTTGPLPPISMITALPAAAEATERPVGRRADEGDGARAGVAGDLVADERPRAGDEVDHAGRQVRLGHALGERDRADRRASAPASTRPCCRHASAGASSSAGIVYGQFQGVMIPTAPRARRTSITRLPGENEFGSSPPRRLASSAAIRQYSTQLVDLVVGLRAQRLALVERERARQLVAAALDRVADRVHLRRALERGQPRPALERAVGGVDRALRVGAVALRHGADRPRRWPGSWRRTSRPTPPGPTRRRRTCRAICRLRRAHAAAPPRGALARASALIISRALLADHHRRDARVDGRQERHDRPVGDPQPAHALHPQARVDHRHRRRPARPSAPCTPGGRRCCGSCGCSRRARRRSTASGPGASSRATQSPSAGCAAILRGELDAVRASRARRGPPGR